MRSMVVPRLAGLTCFVIGVDEVLPDRGAVLVVPADVDPDAPWVTDLVDAYQRLGQPVAAAVVGRDGRVVHAGLSAAGNWFGTGLPADHPLLGAERAGCALVAPFLADALDLAGADGEDVIGRVVGTVHVPTDDFAPPGLPQARVAEAIGASALVITTSAAAAAEAVTAVEAMDWTPVVHCTEVADGADWAPGTIVFSGPGAPITGALCAAFAPQAIVFCDEAALEAGFPALGAAAANAPTVWAGGGPVPSHRVARIDVITSSHLLAKTLRGLPEPSASAPPAPRVAAIPLVAHRPGVVSVVIPVWNRWDLTRACLDSLAANTPEPVEIIVVDNGSTDATPAELAARADVRVITNAENRGFPAAVNQGIAASTGEYVCVLNNDTELTPGWLQQQLLVLADRSVGLVGPRSNSISGLQVVPGAPALADAGAARAWAESWASARQGRSWPANRLVGFCVVARRSLFESLGGFDEAFGTGNFEDDDLCQRILAAGFQLRVADGSVVLHHGSATFTALGLDYPAVLRGAHRRGRNRPVVTSGLLDAIVLGDGDSGAAAATVASALAIADRVTVLEPLGAAATEVAIGAAVAAGRDVRLRALDWQNLADPADAFTGCAARLVLVLAAGERVSVPDWGAARAELDSTASGPIELDVDGVPQVRIHPPGAAAMAAVGGRGRHAARFIAIRSQPSRSESGEH